MGVEMCSVKMQFSVLEQTIFVLDSNSTIVERLVIILAHHNEFNVNVHFPVGGHEIIFEFCEKCFEWEDFELVVVDLNPIFPAGIFQGGHHFHGLFFFGNVFVHHIIPACNLEFVEYFSIEISRMEDGAFTPFLFTDGDVFL